MKGLNSIEKTSIPYLLTRRYVSFIHRIAHRHFVVKGLENIPDDKPIFFAVNHQNALMDAMALVCSLPSSSVFLARADIFGSPLIQKILIFLKIMPIYRMRDGKESLGKNEAIFNHCVRILEGNGRLTLFPEAQHTAGNYMLPHKKAVPRIIFTAAEKNNFQSDIQIIPVGLYYSHYYRLRRDLVVRYGKPIAAKDYYESYQSNAQRATIHMRDAIYEGMDELLLNVRDRKHYNFYDLTIGLVVDKYMADRNMDRRDSVQRIDAMKEIYEILHEKFADDDRIDQLGREGDDLQSCLRALSVDVQDFSFDSKKNMFVSFVRLLFELPFAILGGLANGLPFLLPRHFIRTKIKDEQFWSSFSFGVSIVFSPIWYLLLFLISGLFIDELWIRLAGVAACIPSGLIAYDFMDVLRTIKRRAKYKTLVRKQDPTALRIQTLTSRFVKYFES